MGRVVVFDFGGRELELSLIPHAVNATARTDEKVISFHKPKKSEPHSSRPTESVDPRNLEAISKEWLEGLNVSAVKKITESPQKRIEKKLKALTILKNQVGEAEWLSWRELGDWIKTHQTLNVPGKWSERVNADLSIGQNLDLAYKKAMAVRKKATGTLERIEILEAEIQKLTIQLDQGFAMGSSQSDDSVESPKKSLLKQSSSSGRRQPLREGVELYIGRSANDNLAILRKANPWDYWLHLRDYPGAYGILHRHRGLEVLPHEFELAAQMVAAESAGRYLSAGDRVDCLVAEVRFVRPIKGDRLGRVTFKNERVITTRYNA